jgi:hypothetical protein
LTKYLLPLGTPTLLTAAEECCGGNAAQLSAKVFPRFPYTLITSIKEFEFLQNKEAFKHFKFNKIHIKLNKQKISPIFKNKIKKV